MLRTGVDLIEIERIRNAIDRHGERFLTRVYTTAELDYCGSRIESLAGRFAAKEATAKALQTGIWRDGVNWVDIEVTRNGASGAPFLALHHGAAAKAAELGLAEWSVSLSHDRARAIAVVVALG